MEYYDDNYGHWSDTDDPDVVDFYHEVQKMSVWKTCEGCGRKVKIRRDYSICNACAEKRERGLDLDY